MLNCTKNSLQETLSNSFYDSGILRCTDGVTRLASKSCHVNFFVRPCKCQQSRNIVLKPTSLTSTQPTPTLLIHDSYPNITDWLYAQCWYVSSVEGSSGSSMRSKPFLPYSYHPFNGDRTINFSCRSALGAFNPAFIFPTKTFIVSAWRNFYINVWVLGLRIVIFIRSWLN